MLVNLYVEIVDIEKYNNGEKILATDINGKSVIFKSHMDNVISTNIDSTEIIEIKKRNVQGFVKGEFNEFYIQKNNFK